MKQATSKILDDGAPRVRSRLAEIEPVKRKSKPKEHWLAYCTSQLEERRRKLPSRLLRKSSAVDEPLYIVLHCPWRCRSKIENGLMT